MENHLSVPPSFLTPTDSCYRMWVTYPWLPELKPVRFPFRRIILRLLYLFYCHRVCYYLTESFVFFTAEIFNSYASAALFIAIKDTTILNHIFQKGTEITVGGITFRLLERDPHKDIFYYEITHGYFRMRFIIFGKTTSPDCGPFSNIHLVGFIWQNSERFDSIKYGIVLYHRSAACPPRMLCIKYYRGVNNGWGTRVIVAHVS